MSTATVSEVQRKWEELVAMAYRPMRERDSEVVREAREAMDAAREETKKRVGIVDVAVEFVREARES
jgi:hypothetical protein